MAINKVEFDGQTLIDLTGDTVTQQDVLNGKSFHTPDGVQRSGTASIPVSDVTVDGTSVVTNGVAEVVTDNLAPTVTEASSRTNLAVGDSLKTIISKIKKFFSDLKTVAFTGSYNDLSNTPTKVSDFTNDSGFVTSTVNNLANYYLKSETYTQAQVDALIGAIPTISIEVVQTLPTQDIKTNTIYLVPKQTAGTQNVYDEYIYVNNAWELIGDTEIDLSNYVTTTDLATALQDYVTSTGLSTILANYYTSSQIDTLLGGYLTDSDVSVTQVVSSGTKIATIDVNGTSTDLYAPASGGGSVNDVTVNGSSVVNAQGVAEVTAVQDNPTFTEASTRANIASGESFATILGKIKKFFTDLKTVAFSGSYNDLSNKPTIPTVNNATLTIQKNGSTVKTFTANASSDVTANITVPTKTSDITNDSGFITSDSTKVAKAGDTMTGTLNMQTENNVCINLRPGNADWYDTISTQTSGNEAVVFATKNDATSWIFVNGEDSVTNHASNRWQSLTPALQIKKNCIAIGKLIASASDPTYKCEINGVTYSKGIVVEGRAYNSGDDEGIVIKPSNGWAGVILGSHNAERSCFYFKTGSAFWRYSTGQTNYDISHPKKAGTIALTSDIPTNTNQLTNGAGFITSSGSCASATSFNGLNVKKFTSGSATSITVKFSGSIGTGFVKVFGDGNGSGIDFIIPVHSSSIGSPAGHWVVAPAPTYAAGTNMWSMTIKVKEWNTLWVMTNYTFY